MLAGLSNQLFITVQFRGWSYRQPHNRRKGEYQPSINEQLWQRM